MILKKIACAGTMESSDAYVEIEPCENGIEISIQSVVEAQFSESIRASIIDVLNENQVKNAIVRINDRGALDCVIRARTETAVLRAKGE